MELRPAKAAAGSSVDAGDEIARLELLVRISETLSGSRDLAALGALGDLLVPSFADVCAVDLILHDGTVSRITIKHCDPAKRPLVSVLERLLPKLTEHHAIAEVVKSGEPLLAETIDDETLIAGIGDEASVEAILGLGLRSGIVIPLRGRERVVGVVTLARTNDSGRTFDERDLRIAEDIARLTALAAENAMLLRDIETSHERYRMLVDSIEAIVWEADPITLRPTFVSERAEKMLGYPVARWLHDPDFLERLVLEDDRDWVHTQRLAAIASGDDHEMEYRVMTADGRVVWLHDRLYVARGADDTTALRGLIVDVTERKLTEIRQRAHLATARVFAESASPAEIPAGVLRALLETLGWEVGAVWQAEHGSERLRCIEFVQRAGTHAPEFEAATWRCEFAPGSGLPGRVLATAQPAWIEDVTMDRNFTRREEALRAGLRGAFAFPIVAEGRAQGVLEFYTRSIQRPDESLLQLVGGVGIQMGQFIRRRELEEQLRHSEARTRSIIDAAMDAIVTMDRSGSITGMNPSAAALFGVDVEDAIGRSLAETIIPPSLREAHHTGLTRYLSSGRSEIVGQRLTLAGLRSDGSEFPIELSIAVRDENGEPMFIGFMRDMTEQRIAEQRRMTAHAVTRILAESPSLAEATAGIVETLCRNLGWAMGNFWAPGLSGERMRVVAGWFAPGSRAESFHRTSRSMSFRRGEGVVGRVWDEGRSLWVRDVSVESWVIRAPSAIEDGLHSMFAIPVLAEDEIVGVLEFFSQDIREPDEDLQRMMSGIGIQIGSFIQRQRAREESALQRTLLASQSEASIDGILVLSAENKILVRNQRFVDLWQIPGQLLDDDDAVLDWIYERVTDPDDARARMAALQKDAEAVDRLEIALRDGRTFDRYAAPVVGEDGVRYGRMWTFRDITEQKRAQRALQQSTARSAFLAEVSAALVEIVEPHAMLRDIARLSVPAFADWCAADLVQDDHIIERVALEHLDRDTADEADALRRRVIGGRLDPNAPRGVSRVITTGRSEIEPEISDEWLIDAAKGNDEMLGMLRGMGLRSYICVPLTARGRTMGALSFVTARSERRYGTADLWLAEDLARRVASAIENARLHEETQHVATTLQQSLLPPALPEIPSVALAARFEPAGRTIEVGGDFYDLFSTGRNDWAIVIGDVCGKGTDAAAITALARYTIRASAMQTRRPMLILTQLNEALMRQRDDERFCTVAYGRLRRSRGAFRLTVGSGGHPLPLVLRASGEVRPLGVPGMILGAFDEIVLKEQTTVLEPGDSVVFYTDGVTEAGEPDAMIGEEGLATLLREQAGRAPDDIASALIDAAVTRASGDGRDDIAVVVLKVTGDGAEEAPSDRG